MKELKRDNKQVKDKVTKMRMEITKEELETQIGREEKYKKFSFKLRN